MIPGSGAKFHRFRILSIQGFLTGLTPLPNTPPISSSPTLQSILTPSTTVNTNEIVNYHKKMFTQVVTQKKR